MTRTMTILAFACCVVTGVALAAIFGRGNVLMVRFVATPSPVSVESEPTELAANRESKADRLPVQTAVPDAGADLTLSGSLRPAVATELPLDAGRDVKWRTASDQRSHRL